MGGNYPPLVQGMVKTDPLDVEATVEEIKKIQKAGAKLVRLAIPSVKAAKNISLIRKMVDVPLIADIHFNYRLAIEAIDRGMDKVRINPGNLNSHDILLIAKKAKENKIPLRIGVNSGSLPKNVLEKIFKAKNNKEEKLRLTAEGMVDTALNSIKLLEEDGFEDIVVSLKSSEVPVTILSNKMIAEKIPYPIHVGVTAAGPPSLGIVKSALAIGSLLSEGIGDTIRVSLTASPVKEIEVAYQILKYLDFVEKGPTIIACPTCGRCKGNVRYLSEKVLQAVEGMQSSFKVAIMGCEVNGPGEAMESDIGIVCTKQGGILFKKGHLLNKVRKDELFTTLIRELRDIDQKLRAD